MGWHATSVVDPPNTSSPFTEADFNEEKDNKIVFTVWGDKDGGKTSVLFSLPGKKLCLSFDHKSQRVKDGPRFKSDPNIRVVNCLKFYADGQPEKICESATVTIDYVMAALTRFKESFQPDWVILDGMEILEQIAEMKMRHMHNLKMSQGFPERNWWKDRSAIILSVYRKARECAVMGVCMTTYPKWEEVVTDGQTQSKRKIPNWVGMMMYESDIGIRVECDHSPVGRLYIYKALVDSTKDEFEDIAKKGDMHDLTGHKPFPWGPGLERRFNEAHGQRPPAPVNAEDAEIVAQIEAGPQPSPTEAPKRKRL
jgi:hypothetical protein